MKIHIIGGPGSGKTTLAKRLSEQMAIPCFDLDDLQWDNKADSYGKKRDPDERDDLLSKILSRDDWIIEGVYYAWCSRSFEDADKIYVLSVPRRTYRKRIVRRFVKRKIGLEPGKKESIKSLIALMKWADKFQTENMIEIRKMLSKYTDKVIDRSMNK